MQTLVRMTYAGCQEPPSCANLQCMMEMMPSDRNPRSGRRRPVWTLGERLAKARRDADLTQEELAAKMQLSTNTITNYETGATNPRLISLMAWSEFTNTDLDWLVDGDGPTGGERASVTGGQPTHGNHETDQVWDLEDWSDRLIESAA